MAIVNIFEMYGLDLVHIRGDLTVRKQSAASAMSLMEICD
jgi:hypothetical protein